MMDETSKFDQADIDANKGLAFLSYLALLFLVPLLTNRQSPFTKFHVNQGIVLFIVEIVAGIAARFLRFIPIVGWVLSTAISIGILVLAIMGIVNALSGKAVRLPIIGNIEIYK